MRKLTAEFSFLIRPVNAVISTVTNIAMTDAKMVIAFKLLFRTVLSIRVARWAVEFIRQIVAISVSVAFKVGSNAVARSTLEVR